MNKRTALTVCFISFLALASIVYATYYVYSNILTETVSEYSFKNSLVKDATEPALHTTVVFGGILYYGDVVAPNKQVTLLKSINGGEWSTIATTTTNIDGVFTFNVERVDTGTIEYKAMYQVS